MTWWLGVGGLVLLGLFWIGYGLWVWHHITAKRDAEEAMRYLEYRLSKCWEEIADNLEEAAHQSRMASKKWRKGKKDERTEDAI